MPESNSFRAVGNDETEALPDASLDILLTGRNPTYDIQFDTNRQLHRKRFFQLGLECLLLIFGKAAPATATSATTATATTCTTTSAGRSATATRIREHLGGVGAP